MAADDGPPLIRPIPRRPFDLNRTSPTPPEDEPEYSNPNNDFSGPQWLNAGFPSSSDLSSSISRPQSFLNLTSSTLFGIYSPTATSRDRVFGDRDDYDTPWGTGAQTPIKRPNLDEATYALMRERAHPTRRRSSYKLAESEAAAARHTSAASVVLSLGPRAALLFLLGVGYGALVTRFHSEQQAQQLGSFAEGFIRPGYNWNYLAFWGVSGVVLGALLPWFDKVWEDTFGAEEREEEDDVAVMDADGASTKDAGPGTDWALVVRAIGAFVGIVFAIRKVAWTSTLQVSATLALVNPLLWWLIDRSMSGFLLSTIVGLTGSAFLLGVNPEMMPAPSASPFRNSSSRAGAEELTLGGLASQQTVEAGVWMLSVLFCSCVCFGNIGRRLAWSRSAEARGRWGGVR